MKKFIFLSILLFSITSSLFAQTPVEVRGVVQDTTGQVIFGATVKLINGPSDTLMIRTNIDGAFSLKNVKKYSFTLLVSSLGYESAIVNSVNPEGTTAIILNKIILKATNNVLDVVTINGTPAVSLKTDTMEFRTSDLKLKDGATVEDALKRVDGAEVDKDGNVTAAGKPVTKIKVNGKEVFGGDLKTITKNMPADAIDKIQLIDDYGDQAAFTGVKDGDPEKIINITTKPGRDHGLIANATAGGGTESRYQAGLFASKTEGDQNLGITLNLNNNGLQIGGGNFGGRAGGGGGIPSLAAGGITNAGSLGLTYGDRWSKKLVVSAGYYYNNYDKNTLSNVLRQSAVTAGVTSSTENSNVGNLNTSHNFNGRLQYNIDPSNLLIVSPFISFAKSTNNNAGSVFQTGLIHQDQITKSKSKSTTPNINSNILFNHLFQKAGRNYSVNINLRTNGLNSDQDNDNRIIYYNTAGSTIKDSVNYRINASDNQTFSSTARLIYSEPISKTSRLQFSYNVGYNNYDNSKITSFTTPAGVIEKIDSLSNVFQYSFVSHQVGLNYNFKDKNNDLSLGLTVNPTSLNGSSATLGTSISRTNFFLAPIIRYQYKYAQNKSLMINYFGMATEPQFAQLQPVRDVSNPQRPVIGNPGLNSSFNHNVFANYNTSNNIKHSSFMLNVQASMISNQIVQNIVLVPDAFSSYKQEVRYVNTNGYYTYFAGYRWQKSFADRQYTIRVNGDTRFTNNVAFADNIKNTSQRRNISQRLSLQINPGTWLELTPNLLYSLTTTNYSLPANTDTRINTYGLNLDGKIYFLKSKSLILGFNGDKTLNDGYTGNFNTNPLVINSYIEKQFLKQKAASLRLQAFDILNQSNNIVRTVTENGFTDTETNRLTQYFMFSFTMKINKFAGSAPAQKQDGQRPEGQRPGGQPGGGYRPGGMGGPGGFGGN